jgi:hypothetical protein
LLPEFRLPEPIKCLLPFVSGTPDPSTRTRARGSELFIAEGFESLAELAVTEDGKPKGKPRSSAVETLASPTMGNSLRTFFVTVCYYGVDHTGDILFEQAGTPTDTLGRGPSRPFSAFASTRHRRRISLLPSGKAPLRILQLTMDGDAGFKKSLVSQLI